MQFSNDYKSWIEKLNWDAPKQRKCKQLLLYSSSEIIIRAKEDKKKQLNSETNEEINRSLKI
jgi:hypothetical protein